MTKLEASQYIKANEVYAIVKRLEARIDNLQTSTKETTTSNVDNLSNVDIDYLISKYFD